MGQGVEYDRSPSQIGLLRQSIKLQQARIRYSIEGLSADLELADVLELVRIAKIKRSVHFGEIARQGNPALLLGGRRIYVAILRFHAGVIPPVPMLGGSCMLERTRL